MAQQTAMRIMYDELMAHEYTIPLSLIVKCKELIEVEKDQIIKAWDSGYNCYQIDEEAEINQTAFSGEKHYNDKYQKKDETFKQKSKWTKINNKQQ